MSHREKMGLGTKSQRQKKRSLELRREQGKGNRPRGERGARQFSSFHQWPGGPSPQLSLLAPRVSSAPVFASA